MKVQVLIVTGVATSTFAAKFSVSIHKQESVGSGLGLSSLFKQPSGNLNKPNEKQRVFQQAARTSDSSSDYYVEDHGSLVGMQKDFYMYTTNISLGTPPQPFRATIDLNWASPFFPSSACGGADFCTKFAHYNASASSTFVENGTVSDLIYGPVIGWGLVGTDTLSISPELELPNFDFLEVRYYNDVWPKDELEFFDSALGLSFSTGYDPIQGPPGMITIPSPFRQMIDAETLDSNKFSISFPYGEIQVGDLTFGGSNEDLFEGELIKNPLYPANTTDWQVKVKGLYLTTRNSNDNNGEETTINLTNDLGPSIADSTEPLIPKWKGLIMSRAPLIGLPRILTTLLYNKLPIIDYPCDYGPTIVNCASIPDLPDLIVEFEGQNITLKGENYVEPFTPPEGRECSTPIKMCTVLVVALPEWDTFPVDLMVIGTSLLRTVYSVFDWDEKTVSFGKLRT